jgi:hypothetical protein
MRRIGISSSIADAHWTSRAVRKGQPMIRVVTLLLFFVAFQLCSSPTSAQSPKAIWPSSSSSITAGPTDGRRLDELSRWAEAARYIDGQNIKIDHRNADGRVDQLPRLAEELVRLPVDAVIAVGAEPALSAVTQPLRRFLSLS